MLRVALDLDGSLEPFRETMVDLAAALAEEGSCELVRFRSWSPPVGVDVRLPMRWWWRRWWRAGRGWPLDRRLRADVVHVAGRTVPPTGATPLVVSVEDLRPLRGERSSSPRVDLLRRAVARGATVVTSTIVARAEVARILGVELDRVAVVAPPVPAPATVAAGAAPSTLLVNVAGGLDRYLGVAEGLQAVARARGLGVVVLTSAAGAQRLQVAGAPVVTRHRRDAAVALRSARVLVHLADGARFPSLPLAALAGGIPVVTFAAPVTRELLAGAATLVESPEALVAASAAALDDPAVRAIARAAGPVRAADFHPARAAAAYAELYARVVRDWTT